MKVSHAPISVECLFSMTLLLGSLRGGQSSTREVKLVNRSRLPVSVSMEPSLGVLAAHDVSAANAAAPVVIKAGLGDSCVSSTNESGWSIYIHQ